MSTVREGFDASDRYHQCDSAVEALVQSIVNWYRTFEYVPDEVVLTRIESQHAKYFARMVALQWVRKWTQCEY